jgi:hypothetical protein
MCVNNYSSKKLKAILFFDSIADDFEKDWDIKLTSIVLK